MTSRFSRRRVEGGRSSVSDDSREDPDGTDTDSAKAHATNAPPVDGEQGAPEPLQAISSNMQHDDGHEDSGEVLCEVVDLFYGIELPPENGSRNSGFVSRMVKFLTCARPADDGGAPTKEQDLPRVKPLLQGVGCQVRAGELVAVIGASGAGKSTFLDIVAGRKKDGVCAGEVLMFGEASSGRSSGRGSKSLINASRGIYKRSRPVYITQSDHHVSELTVRESLEFVAKLRMGDGYSDAERAERIDELLAILGLESCANVRVGSSLVRGISGGQSRRLSVGIGMIDLVNTRLVLMDEPTTGLDSISAMEVVQLARRLTSRAENRAILATVHQPSTEMFSLFDKVLVLHKGRQVYFGSAKDGPTILSRPEEGVVPGPGQNPADFILVAGQSVKLDPLPPRGQSSSRPTLSLLEDDNDDEGSAVGMTYAVGFGSQVSALWWRAGVKQSRNVDEILAVIGKFVALGLITGVIFWDKADLDRDEDLINTLTMNVTTSANNCIAAIFFIMLIPVTGHNQAIPDIFSTMKMMSHERVSGSYSTTAAWVTVATMPIPTLFVGFVILLNIVYWCLGFSEYHMKYLRFGGAVFVGNLMGYLISQIVSAACPTPQAAFAAWPMFLIVFFNFAGFTVRLPNVKVWYRWLCDVGFLRWVFQFTMQNQFNDFTEGDAIQDLYFGNIRTSMGMTGFIAVLYYVGFLFVLLYVMQPATSRLRALDETKELVLPGPYEASLTGGGEVSTKDAAKKAVVRGTGGNAGAQDDSGPVMVGLGEPEQVEVSGPLRDMEEGQVAEAIAPAETDEESLRVPLLRADKPSRMTLLDAGVREGSRISLSDLHYYVYTTDDKPKAPTEGSRGSMFGFGGEQNRSEVHVLRGITGVVERGEIAVILGPSGSGKTTLLDLLAGRKTPSTGRQEGDIIVDGSARVQGRRTSPSVMAYVTQDNVHYASLTVRQTLDYAAKLRMSSTAQEEDRERRISSMIRMLKLEKVMDTTVGDDTNRGISGGEMKRLSIAVESIDLPGLLVLDEPTSGLDAPTALEVMTAVRSLADLGRTVVLSLHQPSPEIFSLLDTCLLMTRGGYTAFFGKANEALDYFASIGLRPPPSSDNDPAGFLLSLVSAAETTEDAPSALRPSPLGGEALTFGPSMADRFNSEASESIAPASVSAYTEDEHETMFISADLDRAFRTSVTGTEMELTARRAVVEALEGSSLTIPKVPSERSFVWLSAVLTHRQFVMRFQDKETLYLNLFQSAFMGIFYGTLYWQLDDGMIYERMSCLFFAALVSLSVYQQSIPLFFQDRLLFYRERGAGVYGAVEYWASIGVAPMPLVVVTSIIYVGLLYNCVGLNLDTVEHEWYFLLVVFLCNIISLSVSQLLAAIARLENIAVDLFPIVLFFLLCHGGFLVTLPDLPGVLKGWAPDASFVRWAVEGTFVNELRDNEEHVFPVPHGVNTTSEEIAAAFLDDYGYGTEVGGIPIRTAVIWILVLNYVVFRVLSLAAMQFLIFEKR